MGGEGSRQPIDEAGDENQIRALGNRTEIRRRNRTPMKQRLAGTERCHADRAVAHLHESDVESVPTEVALIPSNIQRCFTLAR